MTMTTLQLKYGQMKIEVEQTDQGFQRVARYRFTKPSRFAGKTFTHRGKVYKRERNAVKDAEKFAAQQARVLG